MLNPKIKDYYKIVRRRTSTRMLLHLVAASTLASWDIYETHKPKSLELYIDTCAKMLNYQLLILSQLKFKDLDEIDMPDTISGKYGFTFVMKAHIEEIQTTLFTYKPLEARAAIGSQARWIIELIDHITTRKQYQKIGLTLDLIIEYATAHGHLHR